MRCCDLAYFAGLFDGEGCVQVHQRRLRGRAKTPESVLLVQITNTNKAVLQQAIPLFAGTVVTDRAASAGRKAVYRWRATGATAEAMLQKVFPYLRIKREQARLGLEFRRTFDGQHRAVPTAVHATRTHFRQQLRLLKTGA